MIRHIWRPTTATPAPRPRIEEYKAKKRHNYRLTVRPEYDPRRLRAVHDDARQVHGAASVYVHVRVPQDTGHRLCEQFLKKQQFSKAASSSGYRASRVIDNLIAHFVRRRPVLFFLFAMFSTPFFHLFHTVRRVLVCQYFFFFFFRDLAAYRHTRMCDRQVAREKILSSGFDSIGKRGFFAWFFFFVWFTTGNVAGDWSKLVGTSASSRVHAFMRTKIKQRIIWFCVNEGRIDKNNEKTSVVRVSFTSALGYWHCSCVFSMQPNWYWLACSFCSIRNGICTQWIILNVNIFYTLFGVNDTDNRYILNGFLVSFSINTISKTNIHCTNVCLYITPNACTFSVPRLKHGGNITKINKNWI